MRRFSIRLLQVALAMVQYRAMAISVKMSDGHSYTIDVAGGVEAAEIEIGRIEQQEGPYSTGWFTERGGKHLRVDDIREMRAFERAN